MKRLAASKVCTSKDNIKTSFHALPVLKRAPSKHTHAKVVAFFTFLCSFAGLHLPIISIKEVLQISKPLMLQSEGVVM